MAKRKSLNPVPAVVPMFHHQADAKLILSKLCKYVSETGERRYIKDTEGTPFMTLDPVERAISGKAHRITVAQFRHQFARISYLVRFKHAFLLDVRGARKPIYIRRHTSYRDPLDPIIDAGIEASTEQAVEEALAARNDQEMKEMRNLLLNVLHRVERDQTDIGEITKKIAQGLGRMANGNHPFNDEPLRKGVPFARDEEN